MGRAKVTLQLMKKKSRMATFKKRKDSLTKKLQELATLCDVGACMIVYNTDEGTTSIWPPEKPDLVRGLVNAYERNSGGIKSNGVSDFFAEKRREVEVETLRLRKKKYPIWDDRLMFMEESQLRVLDAALQCKAETVRSRIKLLKQEFDKSVNSDFTMLQFQEISPAPAFGAAMHCSSKENLGFCLDQNLNYYGVNGGDMMMMMSSMGNFGWMDWNLSNCSCSSMENLGFCLDQNLNYYGVNGGDMMMSSMGNLGWMDRNLCYGGFDGYGMNRCSSMENLDQNLSYCGFDGDGMNQCSSMENLGCMDQSLMNLWARKAW